MKLKTESANPKTENIDQMSSKKLVETFIEEDQSVITAIKKAKKEIASAIDMIHQALKSGGRLIYIGAGTSGRIGVLDASECPPTFSTDPEMVQGIIAGGDAALRKSIEGAEDNEEEGYRTIQKLKKSKSKSKFPNGKDIIVGISASGSAPYVLGALKAASELGLPSIAIANNKNARSFEIAKSKIFLDTGSEILSGSTRLKAGTSQKMVLNIISTAVMVKLGKVYKNLMVDLQASNHKLVKRASDLVQAITDCSESEAKAALEKNNHQVKNAVLCILKGLSQKESQKLLKKNNGFLGKCLLQ